MASLITAIIVVCMVLFGYMIGEIIFRSIRRRIEMEEEIECHILRTQYGIFKIDDLDKPKR